MMQQSATPQQHIPAPSRSDLDDRIRAHLLQEAKELRTDLHYSDLSFIRDTDANGALKQLVAETIEGHATLGANLLSELFRTGSDGDRSAIKAALLTHCAEHPFLGVNQNEGIRLLKLLPEFELTSEIPKIAQRVIETPDAGFKLRFDRAIPALIVTLEGLGHTELVKGLVAKLHANSRSEWHSPQTLQFLLADLAVMRCEAAISDPVRLERRLLDAEAAVSHPKSLGYFTSESYMTMLAEIASAAFIGGDTARARALVERIIRMPDPSMNRDDYDQPTYKPAALTRIANGLEKRGLIAESNWVIERAWESGVQACFNAFWELGPNPLGYLASAWARGRSDPDLLPEPPPFSLEFREAAAQQRSSARRNTYNLSIIDYIQQRADAYLSCGAYEKAEAFIRRSISPVILELPPEHLPRHLIESVDAIKSTPKLDDTAKLSAVHNLVLMYALYSTGRDRAASRLAPAIQVAEAAQEVALRLEKFTDNPAFGKTWLPIFAAHLHQLGADRIVKEWEERQTDQELKSKITEALARRPWGIPTGSISADATWQDLADAVKSRTA